MGNALATSQVPRIVPIIQVALIQYYFSPLFHRYPGQTHSSHYLQTSRFASARIRTATAQNQPVRASLIRLIVVFNHFCASFGVKHTNYMKFCGAYAYTTSNAHFSLIFVPHCSRACRCTFVLLFPAVDKKAKVHLYLCRKELKSADLLVYCTRAALLFRKCCLFAQ